MSEIKALEFKGTDSLENLPEIVLGAGVFNYQYTDTPHDLQADKVLRRAFELGIRALDTSAYYGPSEEIVGQGLENIRDEFPREEYFICTKAGRVAEDEFDYRPASIRKSVERSLQRLRTTYLDVIYIHDVEFETEEHGLEAVGELFRLKEEGKVRWVGITGYPVKYLLHLATKIKNVYGKPLDIILSYCNFCLQNTLLLELAPKFESEAGVRKLLNASPLSMGLLRSAAPLSFHPGSKELKEKVQLAAKYTASQGVELADVASRFAFINWPGCTVFGLQRVPEVENAIKMYWDCKNPEVIENDKPLVTEVQKIFGETMDQVWPSGIEHDF